MESKAQMNILVTGGAGYIGSHTVRQLTMAGHKVVVLDDMSAGFKDSLLHGELLVKGDIGDEDLVTNLIKNHNIDSVLHFAGSIVVSESVQEPQKYYLNNTAKTLVLAQTIGTAKVKNIIFSSTAAVYGAGRNTPVDEDAEVAP